VHFKWMLSFGGAIVAATALVSASGAGAAASPTTARIDLSTKTAVTTYLRSLHVSPKGVVIQRGLRNYAGSSCPGVGWTCTSTSHPVVQIASAAGQNVFQCSTSHCAVVQASTTSRATNAATTALATNTAKCIKTTGLSQSCSISQSSSTANNQAIVVEIANKASGLTQSASQTAQIIQNATGGSNTACVLQSTSVDASTVAKKGTPVTVSLDAHQSVSIAQDSLSGANSVQNATSSGSCDTTGTSLTQSQSLTSTANGSAGVTQNENATAGGPNALIDIKQNQNTPTATGLNTSAFTQTGIQSATATTPNGPVLQTQSSASGGLKATVNQFSAGVSTSSVNQNETQTEHAQKSGTDSSLPLNTTQVQYGPVRCCSNQANNPGDTFTINQSSTQTNDTLQNQTNNVEADCSTSGTCTATQMTTVDGTTTTNTQTGSDVTARITCSATCTPTGNIISVSNTDVAEFGYGGMRGNGVGTITVTGVSAPVTKALLYWNGPTNSADPAANAAVTFGGTPVTGTNIGFASDNNWGFANSQSYRADVTSLVAGNGSYSLADFVKLPDVDVNGAALIVFYNDGNTANDRNVVLFNGNDSNVTTGPSYNADGWDETIAGVPYPGSGSASLDLVVSDVEMQSFWKRFGVA